MRLTALRFLSLLGASPNNKKEVFHTKIARLKKRATIQRFCAAAGISRGFGAPAPIWNERVPGDHKKSQAFA